MDTLICNSQCVLGTEGSDPRKEKPAEQGSERNIGSRGTGLKILATSKEKASGKKRTGGLTTKQRRSREKETEDQDCRNYQQPSMIVVDLLPQGDGRGSKSKVW